MAQVRTQHPKAKLTPLGRQAMVDLVIVEGWGVAATAQRYQVDPKTVRKWRDRYLAEGFDGLADRSSRPRRSPGRTPPEVRAEVIRLRGCRRRGACGCRELCRGWSGGISVLVDESTTAGRSNDLEVSIWLVWWVGGDGWSLIERTVGPVRVVMIDVVDDKLVELAAVPDDGAVEEFASQGGDPAFGERVRHGSAHRCLEDLHTFGSADLVEGVDELAAAVAHERLGVGELVAVVEQQVPRCLGAPDARWGGP